MNIFASRFLKISTKEGGAIFRYYARPPMELLMTQLFEAGNRFEELFKTSADSDEGANVLTAGLGNQAVPVINGNIESHEEPIIRWRDDMLKTGQSAVGSIELYSDKTKTKLNTNAVTFYAFNIYLLKKNKKSTEQMMNKVLTPFVFIPTNFSRLHEAGVPVINDKLRRLGHLSRIHFAIGRIIEPGAKVEITCCPVKLRDGTNVRIDFAIGNYCPPLRVKRTFFVPNMVITRMNIVPGVMLNVIT